MGYAMWNVSSPSSTSDHKHIFPTRRGLYATHLAIDGLTIRTEEGPWASAFDQAVSRERYLCQVMHATHVVMY